MLELEKANFQKFGFIDKPNGARSQFIWIIDALLYTVKVNLYHYNRELKLFGIWVDVL